MKDQGQSYRDLAREIIGKELHASAVRAIYLFSHMRRDHFVQVCELIRDGALRIVYTIEPAPSVPLPEWASKDEPGVEARS